MKLVRLVSCISILILFPIFILAQPKCYIEHYGAEDGLPQHTVMDMLQDEKGFMWFSTWDGLCKFDGYSFTTYKIRQSNMYHMRSNRMDRIMEDKDGYIWTLSYDKEVHRFDPRTERFMGLKSLSDYEASHFFATNIIFTPSGKVWLISDDLGCVSVVNPEFNVETFNVENGKIKNNKIHTVFEDEDKNSWILTNDGLYAFSQDKNSFASYPPSLNASGRTPFFTAKEIHNEIWFGSSNGKILIYNKRSKQFRLFATDANADITDIKSIDENRMLISTNSIFFFIYDIKIDRLRKLDVSKGLAGEDSQIRSSYIDKLNNIWFELDRLGVSKFNLDSESLTHFSINVESPIAKVTAPHFFVIEDKFGRIWVHPRGGGFSLYDPKTNKLNPFLNEPNSSSWKFSSMLHAGCLDRQGNLWLSTHSNGLDKVVFSEDIFKPVVVDVNKSSSMNNLTRCIFEDDERKLWVSTKNGKIQVYDSDHKPIGYLCEDGTIGNNKKPIAGLTYCMMQDNESNIWVGTKGEGIYKLEKNGNVNSYKATTYRNNPSDAYSLSNNNVYTIFQDSKNRIWVGTYGGGLNLLTDKGQFISDKNLLKGYPSTFGSQIRIIAQDKFNNLCIGTTLGLIMLSTDFDSYDKIDYKFYTRKSGDNTSLTSNDIYDIVTTQKGETFLANFGGGINKIDEVDEKGFPTRFRSFTRKDGLSSDISLLIAEDHDGKLWITSEGNISKFDPDNNVFKTYSEIYRLIKGNAFSEGAKCVSRRGIVYIGYSQGFLAINPHIIKDNTFKPHVAFTKFQLANKDVHVGDDSPLTKTIDDLDKLVLNNKQNFFNIEFAAVDHVETKQIMYAYKLDGFDEDWVVAQQRVATYNNLSPGEYVFRVKSTNSDGIWMDNEHSLPISIVPSFWQTNWAIALYVILFIAALTIVLRSLFEYFRMKDKVALEEEQIEMKTRFFMDISHEIRTPLTMVVSPIENILEENYSPADTKSQLQLVLKNANRMLNMVNQILDFRKIQKTKLNIEDTRIGDYVEDICHNFSKTAEIQGVNLKINNTLGEERLWVDKDGIEKLMFNLLSNAFKYTPVGKDISVNIYKRNNYIAIEVVDEGKGMSKDVQSKLFTRFASFSEDKSKPSTGIGLSIVKEIADKHHAKIEVHSEQNNGSRFTIMFQTGLDHLKSDDVEFVPSEKEKLNSDLQERGIENDEVSMLNIVEVVDAEEEEESNQRQSILVVEDDADLRGFIRKMLESYYVIYEAENGRVGYEIACAQLPDFIISDIMMPEMDGVELLQNVRENKDTSHIPLILLSAKTNIESRLEGLKYGADDYITKPFSVKYLKARIDNIISLRRNIYRSFVGGSKLLEANIFEKKTNADNLRITVRDELFIKKAKEVIEQNIDNSDFVVDNLVSAMAMSRTVFFKKLKSLTSLAPVEFIREVKIKYAAQMIIDHDYTIKEISFMIGISDPKYFTKWFKNIMGMTPMEYRERNKG